MKSDRLKRALQEDTGILTSALGWLDEEMERVQEASVRRETMTEDWIQLKGEARLIRRLKDELGKMGRVRDGTQDQQRNGEGRPRISRVV